MATAASIPSGATLSSGTVQLPGYPFQSPTFTGLRHRHRDRHHAVALAGGADRVPDAGAIATDDMHRSVDDDLRRVDLAIAAHLRIGFLARREARIRQRVLPAEIVPVIDRHAHR